MEENMQRKEMMKRRKKAKNETIKKSIGKF